ncbi:ABC transporter permease [Kitasatospora cineracea]|uniref:ABC transport system permease protein n=1 Tax=Kitasatospora cineracea TaxID=88074 RepID=A0A3N4RKU8_9ACTN|nr:FtsX-like permease family protein [Kitasatospora cineracea]RPE33386.1 putative ABC transport system permease protein [Kitasatospora cineracea]
MLTTALRNVLAHKARLLMTVLAVCLGVAFVSGTLVFADSTAAAHRAAASRDFADVAVTVTAKESPSAPDAPGVLTDALAHRLAEVPGVAAVRPSVDGTAVLNAADGTPLRVKRGTNLAAAYDPARHPVAEGRAPAAEGEIAVDRGTASAGGLHLGDPVTLATDGPALTVRLVGTVTTRDSRVTAGGTLVLFDRATAQKLFSTPGNYTGIDVSAEPGTGQYELAERIEGMLPADRAEVTTGQAQVAQQALYVGTLTRGYQKMPMVFAGVALFVGSFLVVNTFTMLISRRTREIALLRAVGATRRQVVRSLLAEAALVGVVASALGFVLGLGVAAVLPDLLSGDGARLPEGPLVIGARPVAAALFVGVGVTVLAAWLPSRRAARIAPVEALRSAARPAGRSRPRTVAGAALLLLGTGLLVSLAGSAEDASEENLRSAMLGCGVLVVALVLLAPVLAPPVVRLTGPLARRFGTAGLLARQNALRDPRRTAATAATLLISTALVSGLATIGNSTGRALDRQAAAGLGADYVISTGDTMTGLDPAAVRRVAGTPGVRTAGAVADSTAVIGGRVREVSGVDPADVSATMRLDFVSGSLQDLGPGRIAVSSSVARETGVGAGGRLNTRLGRGAEFTEYTVVGVYRDNPTARDAIGARDEVQRDSYLPGSLQRILVRGDGVSEGALRTAVGNNPLLKVQDRAALVREAAGTTGDLLTLMYGLLAIGVLISGLGIVNTLAMSVAERTREIGALRALGMDRAAVRRMIRLEALTVAAFGTLLGLAGGLFGAWALGALAGGALDQYALALPWGTLALLCLASLAVGALAAAVPARRAAALSPLEAVAEA